MAKTVKIEGSIKNPVKPMTRSEFNKAQKKAQTKSKKR